MERVVADEHRDVVADTVVVEEVVDIVVVVDIVEVAEKWRMKKNFVNISAKVSFREKLHVSEKFLWFFQFDLVT